MTEMQDPSTDTKGTPSEPSASPKDVVARTPGDGPECYYWPALEKYLLEIRRMPAETVASIGAQAEHILDHLPHPSTPSFDVRGLVLGHVQSGKTASYTALIARAADAGYRLIVVLTGIHNSLRLQTQKRLDAELVGRGDGSSGTVPLPPHGKQWITLTRDTMDGEFNPGHCNQGPLQGEYPILLVMKKNATALRRLLEWLEPADDGVLSRIPLLMIDDEADLASIDTRGSYQLEDQEIGEEYEPPSTINQLIRTILLMFDRSAYVAYTATPFANILIPHDTFDPTVADDLYPRDFIVPLATPAGYLGAAELFGLSAPGGQTLATGMDVIRTVTGADLDLIEMGEIPPSLDDAILDFILAGVAREKRVNVRKPATMLVHVSRYIADQGMLSENIREHVEVFRRRWRYFRDPRIRERLRTRWESNFRPVTVEIHPEFDIPFEALDDEAIDRFLDAIQVRTINSATDEVLDYHAEPELKAIAVGGDRLSRGLTLEGLLVSYFTRQSTLYDTLMQMGRWFGFRPGYGDLIRIHMLQELQSNFSDLAFVEHQLREDVQMYVETGMKPCDVGLRIIQHPSMQVTGPLKRRFATTIDGTLRQDYSATRVQTFRFRLGDPAVLREQMEANLSLVREFLPSHGPPMTMGRGGPVWNDVPAVEVERFLRSFHISDSSGGFFRDLICDYIAGQTEVGELSHWTVAVMGRAAPDPLLGTASWNLETGPVNQIERSQILNTGSIGVLTAPGDETVGLTEEERTRMEAIIRETGAEPDIAARRARDSGHGLLLLYPVSRYSGQGRRQGNRRPLIDDPTGPDACDLIGLAISFPQSRHPRPVMYTDSRYITGTVGGWNDVRTGGAPEE